jgi:hypothetical protein
MWQATAISPIVGLRLDYFLITPIVSPRVADNLDEAVLASSLYCTLPVGRSCSREHSMARNCQRPAHPYEELLLGSTSTYE